MPDFPARPKQGPGAVQVGGGATPLERRSGRVLFVVGTTAVREAAVIAMPCPEPENRPEGHHRYPRGVDSRMPVLAQVRGAAVASVSGAVSIAAHGMAGGGMPPSQSAVVLLLAACAGVGAAVAAFDVRDRNRTFLLAALTAGQVVGHTTLTVVDDHAHDLGLSSAMFATHLAAVAVSAALVRAVEGACLHVLAAFTRVLLVLVSVPPVQTVVWSATPIHRATLSLWLLAGTAAGTRGPPTSA